MKVNTEPRNTKQRLSILVFGLLLACSLTSLSASAAPECSDGIDNDHDGGNDQPGLKDYNPIPGLGDPDCSSPDDTTEVFLRQPLCAADGEYRIRAVYSYKEGDPSRFAPADGNAEQRIRDYVSAINGLLWKDAQKFGTSRDFKVKCINGVTDVMVVKVLSGADPIESIALAGGNSTLEQYWNFYDDCQTCTEWQGGFGLGCGGEVGVVENCGNQRPSWGGASGNMLLMDPDQKWRAAGVMSQESLHAMGIMSWCAPNNDGQPLDGTVHADGYFYPYYLCETTGVLGKSGSHGINGPDPMSKGTLCSPPHPFDCNNDDFFNPDPQPGNFLYNSFNLGASYINWIDGDGIYPWRGYMFSAGNSVSGLGVPKEITRSASPPAYLWNSLDPALCSVPELPSSHWTQKQAYTFAAYPGCNYAAGGPDPVNTQMTIDVDLSRTYSPTLKWDQWYDFRSNCGNCDKVTVDYSVNGGPWVPVWTLTNPADLTAWTTTPTYVLTNAACQSGVKIRFTFDSISAVPTGDTSKGWYVDGIRIAGPEGGCGGKSTAPRALTAQHIGGPGSGKVKLDWTVPANVGTGILGYTIYRNDPGVGNGGPKTPLTSLSPGLFTYTDTPVSNGLRYYYEVTAVTAYGESPRSEEARALPDLYFVCPATTSTSGTETNCANMQNSDDASAVATLTETKTCSNKFCLNQVHNASSVGPVGVTHTLQVRGRQVTNAEVLNVQVYDFVTGTYTTRITFSNTTLTTKSYALTANEWNNGSPRIKFLDASNDGKQSTWYIDYAKVVSQ